MVSVVQARHRLLSNLFKIPLASPTSAVTTAFLLPASIPRTPNRTPTCPTTCSWGPQVRCMLVKDPGRMTGAARRTVVVQCIPRQNLLHRDHLPCRFRAPTISILHHRRHQLGCIRQCDPNSRGSAQSFHFECPDAESGCSGAARALLPSPLVFRCVLVAVVVLYPCLNTLFQLV
ncbi:hypothetical protein C8F04DRAFT_1399336, partial [Mycena alexandri]